MLSSSAVKDRKRALLNTATDHRSYTALHLAVEAGHADIAHLLIRHVRLAGVSGACKQTVLCQQCREASPEGCLHVPGLLLCRG